jgi:hypothetical protein
MFKNDLYIISYVMRLCLKKTKHYFLRGIHSLKYLQIPSKQFAPGGQDESDVHEAGEKTASWDEHKATKNSSMKTTSLIIFKAFV